MTTARPFRPFLVKMASGQTFTVRHPENAACDPRGRDMIVFEGRDIHQIEMLLVEDLVPLPEDASPTAETGAPPAGPGDPATPAE
jgi:hypothetical protein